MGEVWAGVHSATGIPVALKVVLADVRRLDTLSRALRDEVRAVATLSHPGVVPVLDQGIVGREADAATDGRLVAGSPFFAMEWVDGVDLPRTSWSAPGIHEILGQILRALGHAHARGILHLDVKPANVLFESLPHGSSRARLTDFGLSMVWEKQLTGGAEIGVRGTPAYMAPEQFEARWRDYGPSTDLYAVGCLAYELAYGRVPFDGDSLGTVAWAHREVPPPIPASALTGADPFWPWVSRLLSKAPEDRFETAADAGRALENTPSDWRVSSEGPSGAPDESSTISLDPGESAQLGPDALAEPHKVRPDRPLEFDRDTPAPPMPEDWRALAVEENLTLPPASLRAGLGMFGLRELDLVGREAERDLLWNALAEVKAGGGPRMVAIVGAAGTGKSRLARWLTRAALESGVARSMVSTHAPEPGRADGLGPMVGRYLTCVGLDWTQAKGRLERWASKRRLEDPHFPRALLALMDLDPPESESRGFSADPQRHATARQLLTYETEDRPLILWLDDIQWGQDALNLVALLAESRLPVLVVMTARREALAGRAEVSSTLKRLLDHPHGHEINLPPLESAEQARLVRDLLHLEGDLAAQVEERTAGNPLFAVELVGGWVERGALEAGPRGLQVSAGKSLSLPEGLHAVWTSRIQRLLSQLQDSAGARAALERAAALGREIEESEWAAVSADVCAPETLAALRELLLDRHLAERTESGWMFVHGMLAESLELSAQESGAWTRHHAACAQVLGAGPTRGENASRLGRHRLESGDAANAVKPLLKGAHHLLNLARLSAVNVELDRLEVALERSVCGSETPIHAQLWALRARSLFRQGRFEEMVPFLELAEPLAHKHHLFRELQVIAGIRGNLANIVDDDRETYRQFRRSYWYARLWSPLELRRDLVSLGRAYEALGRQTAARRTFEKARSNLEGDVARTNATMHLGILAAERKEWPTAIRLLGEAAEEADRAFYPWLCPPPLQRQAGVFLRVGDPAAALRTATRAMELEERHGGFGLPWIRVTRGRALTQLSRYFEAEHDLASADSDFDRNGIHPLARYLAGAARLVCAIEMEKLGPVAIISEAFEGWLRDPPPRGWQPANDPDGRAAVVANLHRAEQRALELGATDHVPRLRTILELLGSSK